MAFDISIYNYTLNFNIKVSIDIKGFVTEIGIEPKGKHTKTCTKPMKRLISFVRFSAEI